MTYRNPRFSVLHAALIEGSGSTVVANGTAGPDSVERLRDQRHRALFSWDSTSTLTTLRTTRGVGSPRERVNRLIIPPGHNLYELRPRFSVEGGLTGGSTVPLLDTEGVAQDDSYPSSGLVDLEFTDSEDQVLDLVMRSIQSAQTFEIGELWWTRVVQPLTGIDPRFTPGPPTPNEVRVRTGAGVTYVFDRGEPVREFDLLQRAVSSADKTLYEQLVDDILATGGFVWFDHPASGDAVRIAEAFDNAGDWLLTNATLGAGTSRNGTDPALTLTASSAGRAIMQKNLSEPIDLRGSEVRFTFSFPEATDAWVTAADSIRIRFSSSAGTYESRWHLGEYITGATTKNVYYRATFPIEAVNDSGTEGPADVSAIERFRIDINAAAGGDNITCDRIEVIDRNKQPVLCELDRYQIEQDNPNPNGPVGPQYRVSMVLREVIV